MKTTILVIGLFFAVAAHAQTLSSADSDLISGAGIPTYENSKFVYGDRSLGYRFATSDAPDAVRQWYVEQLGNWSLMNDYGLWVLYEGAKGLDFGSIMSITRVTVDEQKDLPSWHSLDKAMTTEIMIYLGN